MTYRWRSAIGVLVLAGVAAGGYALANGSSLPGISVNASPREVYIADTITYTVRIIASADQEIKPPDETLFGDVFEVRRVREKIRPRGKGKSEKEYIYELAAFAVGEQRIPPQAVWYRSQGESEWQRSETEPVAITVRSLLAQDPQPRLRPLKPALSSRGLGFWGLTAVLLLGGLAAAAWRLIPRRNLPPPASAIPAHCIALQELEELRQQKLIEQGKMEEFFRRLSGCVRHYVENRFRLRAPQMSTEEFLETAKASPLLQADHKQLLRDFLSLADLVKFARYGSSPAEAEQAYNAAHHFVEHTKEAAGPHEAGKAA